MKYYIIKLITGEELKVDDDTYQRIYEKRNPKYNDFSEKGGTTKIMTLNEGIMEIDCKHIVYMKEYYIR